MNPNIFNQFSYKLIVLVLLLSICYTQTDICVDYDEYEVVEYPDFDVMIAETRVELGLNKMDYIAEITAEFLEREIICNEADGCNFECSATAACYQAIFECNSKIGCNLQCDGGYGCGQLNFHADGNQQQIHIECNTYSCPEMQIFISDTETAHIHCVKQDACRDMIIHFTNTVDASVTCYNIEACRNVQIISDKDTHIALHMYAYSSNIILHSAFGFSPDITCNLDSKFIQYSYGENNLDTLIRAEYGSQMKLPCEDIVVERKNSGVSCLCTMVYQIKSADIFNDLPNQTDNKFEGTTCVNIALSDVMSLKCQGNCAP